MAQPVIILNLVLRKWFFHDKNLRYGGSLPPPFFVLVIDFLYLRLAIDNNIKKWILYALRYSIQY